MSFGRAFRGAREGEAGYTLQPNEVVILKDESVKHGGSSYTDELILTNLNFQSGGKKKVTGSSGSTRS